MQYYLYLSCKYETKGDYPDSTSIGLMSMPLYYYNTQIKVLKIDNLMWKYADVPNWEIIVINLQSDICFKMQNGINKEFIVFDANSKFRIKHKTVSQCIPFDSVTKKITLKIIEMKQNGWKMLNIACKNPACIMYNLK